MLTKHLKKFGLKKTKLLNHYGSTLWHGYSPFPSKLKGIIIDPVDNIDHTKCKYIISCISPKLGYIEDAFIEKGFIVVSISPHKRHNPESLLTVIEFSKDQILESIKNGDFGFYNEICKKPLKSPNCVVCGTSVALKALALGFGGLGNVSITTFQSLSGRGDALYDPEMVVSNVYPLRNALESTENDIKTEIKLLLGNSISNVSVSAYRVSVQRGHLIDIRCNLKNKKKLSKELIYEVFENYDPLEEARNRNSGGLPSLDNSKPITIIKTPGNPRPRTHTGGPCGSTMKD